MERRAITWFDYLWLSGESTMDEEAVLGHLPESIRAEITPPGAPGRTWISALPGRHPGRDSDERARGHAASSGHLPRVWDRAADAAGAQAASFGVRSRRLRLWTSTPGGYWSREDDRCCTRTTCTTSRSQMAQEYTWSDVLPGAKIYREQTPAWSKDLVVARFFYLESGPIL